MQKIDNRQETNQVNKVISCVGSRFIFLHIKGMNPRHAIEEMKAAGGHADHIKNDCVDGHIECISDEAAQERAFELLENGWEWK